MLGNPDHQGGMLRLNNLKSRSRPLWNQSSRRYVCKRDAASLFAKYFGGSKLIIVTPSR